MLEPNWAANVTTAYGVHATRYIKTISETILTNFISLFELIELLFLGFFLIRFSD
jgi:hypothetical protein